MDGVGADMEIWGWEIEMTAGFLRKFLVLMYVLNLLSSYLSLLDCDYIWNACDLILFDF